MEIARLQGLLAIKTLACSSLAGKLAASQKENAALSAAVDAAKDEAKERADELQAQINELAPDADFAVRFSVVWTFPLQSLTRSAEALEGPDTRRGRAA